MKKRTSTIKKLLYIVLIFYAAVTLLPFIWALSSSFKTFADISSGSMNFFPKHFTFDNYTKIFKISEYFPRWFFNSALIAIVGTLLNLIFNSMSGYALARFKFPGKKGIFFMILAVLMIPFQVTMIPTYLILSKIGWLDTYQGLIIPGMVNATFIFMMRQFFINFPKELEEAAAIDGLSKFGTFFKIVLPLARPALAAQAIFVFMGFWNDFLRPLIVMSDPSMYTLTVGLNSFKGQHFTYWNYIMSASMISTIPLLILYIVFNRFFIKGVSFTGGKG